MTEITRRGVALILGRIKAFHYQQDVGESVISAWHDALRFAGVQSERDAFDAVVRHYATPGCNPWITPGDVVAGVRAIRLEREAKVARQGSATDGDLTQDVDPNDIPAYLATLRARREAIWAGATLDQALALPLPPEAAHALVDRTSQPVILERGL